MRAPKYLFALLLTCLGLAGMTAATHASTLEDIQKRGELRVAVQTQGPPFSMVDKKGERTGSSVELAKLMAQEMGVKVVFLDLDWDGLIPALLSGKADMLAADMTPTLARAMKVAFTKPWIHVGPVVATKEGSKFTSVEACKAPGARIAVLFGSTGEKLAKTLFAKGQIKSYKGGGPLLLDAVKNGQADCLVNDSTAVAGQAAGYPKGTFKVFPELLAKESLAFATRYDSLDLLTWMNLFIDQTTMDGRLQNNLDYWVNSAKWKEEH
ncbi:amino acid ABC transporter substrate-binding protein [Oxalobacteraceae bacterium OM1]|nr:amino acid ABC transporter substrate-binding protein [Oxalobacteraceae bacterium OM1]